MIDSLKDIYVSLKKWHLWTALGWLELRQRYKRSIVGPFWITISMGVLILALGLIYGELFKMDVKTYLPMLAIGLVFWTFMSNVINEGCSSFIATSPYITQLPTPKFIFILQMLWRNLMMLCHNLVIVLAVLIYFNEVTMSAIFQFLLGFILVTFNLVWIALLGAIISVRFRDVPQIVTAFMQVIFYITPILFSGQMLAKYSSLLILNPFSWFIDIIRSPLLSEPVASYSYKYSVILAIIGSIVTLIVFSKSKDKISYWV
ncbi:ABC transporter permease [Photobacterium ganghwense]|uniref:ABC transporter permease n=1 Tax=Photobacterium ganghwense TaxID=320778 RepID=UPI001C2CC8A1|nr:ABC transporter permease [Photobacterium ganghwense]MBV1838999.1 ABC transporter permease [Photobacterium ganghwense]